MIDRYLYINAFFHNLQLDPNNHNQNNANIRNNQSLPYIQNGRQNLLNQPANQPGQNNYQGFQAFMNKGGVNNNIWNFARLFVSSRESYEYKAVLIARFLHSYS